MTTKRTRLATWDHDNLGCMPSGVSTGTFEATVPVVSADHRRAALRKAGFPTIAVHCLANASVTPDQIRRQPLVWTLRKIAAAGVVLDEDDILQLQSAAGKTPAVGGAVPNSNAPLGMQTPGRPQQEREPEPPAPAAAVAEIKRMVWDRQLLVLQGETQEQPMCVDVELADSDGQDGDDDS